MSQPNSQEDHRFNEGSEPTLEDILADDFRAPRPQGRLAQPPNSELLPRVLAIYLFIAFCSMFYWYSSWYDLLWCSGKSVFQEHEYWRPLTAVLVHADLGHLLSNGPFLIVFGWFLWSYFGALAFPVVPLLLGTFANVITLYFYEPETRLLGASGMIYAMAGLWLGYYVRFDERFTIMMRIFRALAFILIVLFPTTFVPETSYLCHAVGLGLGLCAGAFLPAPAAAKTDLDSASGLGLPAATWRKPRKLLPPKGF